MSLVYARADVYVEERDLSGIVANVPTSIGAIVYASKTGRLERQLFTTSQDWLDHVGVPDASISFTGYAALPFLAESNQLWGKRAIGAGYAFGGVALQKKTSQPIALIPDVQSDPRDIDAVPPGQDVDWEGLASASAAADNLCYFYADGPGSYSNLLAIEIVSDNMMVPSNVTAADATTVGPLLVGIDLAGSITPATYEYKVTAVNNVGETLGSTLASVTITASGVSVFITWDPVVGAKGYKIYGRASGQFEYIATVGSNAGYYLDYGDIVPSTDVQPPLLQTMTSEFTVNFYDDRVSPNAPAESYVVSMTEAVDGNGRQLEIEQAINGQSPRFRVQSNASEFLAGTIPTVYSIDKMYMAPGSSGTAVTSSNIVLAWDLFADKDAVDIRILINGGYATPTVQQKMISLAKDRGDCFAILDCPADQQSATHFADYRNLTLNANTSRAAIYGPDVKINDPYSGKVLFVPPSGYVAGVFAYTDSTTYPWFAPAGLNRGLLDSVLGIRVKYSAGEKDMLHDAQCNYIRNMPGLGIAVWEERTLQAKLSALSFINVRRLLDTIELAMSRAQVYNLMEPNDDFTRTQIKSALEEYLALVKNARGVNNYQVVCDKRNNPPALTGQGQLMVDIFIEPTLPAEKIVLRVSVTKQGASFEELIKNGALS